MALSDDPRNKAEGHIEHVGGELGTYSQVVLSVIIEADQWAAIQASTVEAAMLVSWLAANTQQEV